MRSVKRSEMMANILPPESEFIAWLETLPPGRRIGYCADPLHCPVTEWIASLGYREAGGGAEIAVTHDYVQIGNEFFIPPRWLAHVLDITDDVGDLFHDGNITAGGLLLALKPAYELAKRTFKQRRAAAIHFMAQGDKPGWKGDHSDG